MNFVWENTIIIFLIALVLFASVGWLIIRSIIRSIRK
ncbi:hypothetical protein ABIC22_005831 [Paenibacillus sp. PvP094]